MGKDSAIKSLGSVIGNTIVHKILREKTKKPESKGFLESEELEYRAQARKRLDLYNWNDLDIKQIKECALKIALNKFNSRYTDVPVSKEELEEAINEEMGALLKNIGCSG